MNCKSNSQLNNGQNNDTLGSDFRLLLCPILRKNALRSVLSRTLTRHFAQSFLCIITLTVGNLVGGEVRAFISFAPAVLTYAYDVCSLRVWS